MGRASRWLKCFLGMKKDGQTVAGASLASSGSLKREKKRWSFSGVKLLENSTPPQQQKLRLGSQPPTLTGAWTPMKRSSKVSTLLAVENATAAVAFAEAAVAALKLTGKRRRAGGKEARAAVKIQSDFRGFLARKALKGLVKIQALVRGYLVRKQAATALRPDWWCFSSYLETAVINKTEISNLRY